MRNLSMKVKMKKYSSPIRIDDWFDEVIYKKYKRYPPTQKMNKFETIIMKILDGGNWVLNKTINKWAMDSNDNRVKVHIDNWDIWNADLAIALIVHPLLLKLRESGHYAGFIHDDDVPEELRNGDSNDGDMYFKKSDYILDKMIFAFEHLANPEWEDEYIDIQGDMKFIAIDLDNNEVDADEYDGEIMYRVDMSDVSNHTDDDTIAKINEEIREGLRLFGKYFRTLWT